MRPSAPVGKHPLAQLVRHDPRLHGFYQEADRALVEAVLEAYRTRTELVAGGSLAAGASLADDALHFTWAGLVGGFGYARGYPVGLLPQASDTDLDMLTAGAKVLQPIFSDGADASDHEVGVGEDSRFAVVFANSDGAGGAAAAGTSLKALVVFAGTATDYDGKAAPPTSAEISRALAAATGVHDGTTCWSWYAHGTWSVAAGPTPALAFTRNPNNVLDL